MTSTDVTQTRDTSAVTGNPGPASTGTGDRASIAESTVYGGGGGGDNNKPATQPDTSGAQGGHAAPEGYSQGAISQNLDTGSGGGSPIQQANPAYRAPSGDVSASVRDTSLTDRPISNGTDPTSVSGVVAGNMDTVNMKVPLRTTTTNTPTTPGTPTVVALPRAVQVNFTQVADPAGAPITGYRIEGSTGGVTFVGRNATSATVRNLVPSQSYKFRVAAVNDNGEGAYSAFSAGVVPLNPDEAGPGAATTVSVDNRTNPIYTPDGKIKPGTGGTCGPVTSLVVAQGAAQGTIDITFAQPTWGAPTGFRIETRLAGALVSTRTSTDLVTGVADTIPGLTPGSTYEVTVTPTNAAGDGIASKGTAVAKP